MSTINYEFYKGLFHDFNTSRYSIEEAIDDANKRQQEFYKKFKKAKDERTVAIIGVLMIENSLNSLLSTTLNLEYLDKGGRNLTFVFKVNLAISLHLMPRVLLESIEPVRMIRNIFAHDLDMESFKQAKEIEKNEKWFKELKDKIAIFESGWSKTTSDLNSFMRLVYILVLGIDICAKGKMKKRQVIKLDR